VISQTCEFAAFYSQAAPGFSWVLPAPTPPVHLGLRHHKMPSLLVLWLVLCICGLHDHLSA
jgi:hypothetical protein